MVIGVVTPKQRILPSEAEAKHAKLCSDFILPAPKDTSIGRTRQFACNQLKVIVGVGKLSDFSLRCR